MRKRLSILIVLAMLFQAFAFISASAEGEVVFGTTVTYDKKTNTVVCNVENLAKDEITQALVFCYNNRGEVADDIGWGGEVQVTSIDTAAKTLTAKLNFTLKQSYEYTLKLTYKKNGSTNEIESARFNTGTGYDRKVFESADDIRFWHPNAGSFWKAYYREWDDGEYSNINNRLEVKESLGVGYNENDEYKIYNVGVDLALSGSTTYTKVSEDESGTRPYFVSDTIMSTGIGENNQGNRYTVAKGFIAPYTGTVTIEQNNTVDSTKKKEIWGPKSADDGIKIKITKNTKDNVIWPVPAAGSETSEGNNAENYVIVNKDNKGVYTFEPQTVNVQKGDILYFEARNKDQADKWSCSLYWNPVVTYTSITPNDPTIKSDISDVSLDQEYNIAFDSELNSFNASNVEIKAADGADVTETPQVNRAVLNSDDPKQATFSFNNLENGARYTVTLKNLDFKEAMIDKAYTYTFEFNTKGNDEVELNSYQSSQFFGETNPNSVWSWQYVNETDKNYTDLTYKKWSSSEVNINGKQYQAGISWKLKDADGGEGDGNALSVGQYVMIAGNSTSNSSAPDGNYAAKTFTAPQTGYIQISAADPNGENKIWGGVTSGNAKGARVFINKTKSGGTTETVWSGHEFNYDSSAKDSGASVYFKPMIIEVKKGDKLHFETAVAGNWWGSAVYWDPIVQYIGVKPETVFTDGSGVEKTAAEALDLEQTYVTVSALNLSDYAGREATPIAVVYGADGTLKRVVLSPSAIKVKASENEAGEESSVKLDLGNLKELNASKIKILLWDMTSGSAKPISVPVEAQK